MSHNARSWVVATSNAGKLREVTALLAPLGIHLLSQRALEIEPPEETATTFVENALLKARHAARASGRPALADDSGLLVDALGGAPGVRSARYGGKNGDDRANVAKLLEALSNVPDEQRGASFYCAIVALATPEDPAPLLAIGRWRGSIARAPRGANGFGYDPVFVDAASGQTAAELPAERKNAVSHRGQALAALVRQLAGAA